MLLLAGVSGCSWYDNQTTFFNTYYNMKRIRQEVVNDFEYQDESNRKRPRVLVPAVDSLGLKSEAPKNTTYQFLRALAVERSKLAPMSQKVDSILIKGSKVVGLHPKSEYVQGALYLMAEAYFFRSEWVPSQQKCLELIERYQDGEYSPDAHLLLAKVYLMQRKITQGKQALSKAVDVAWYKDRYDILSEAYRIQAEIHIEDGEIDKAVNPYKQALVMTDDSEQRSRWLVDIGSIYYRMGNYKLAEKNFAQALDEAPDALAEFESKLYMAASIARQDRADEASALFAELEDNKIFTEWGSFIQAERIALDRLRSDNPNDKTLLAREKFADTSFVGRPELMAQSFQKGMALYKRGDYQEAMKYFAKAKLVRTPVYDVANKYFTLLKQWDEEQRKVLQMDLHLRIDTTHKDSIMRLRASSMYAIGRVHEQLDAPDSARSYYQGAYQITPPTSDVAGRYLYSQARMLREKDPNTADSLFEFIADTWPRSEYAKEASVNLGYTTDASIDDAAELYKSATSFRQIKDYPYASQQYMNIVNKFPTSDYAPKALYAMGWMFERDRQMNDSALHYYGMLIEKYPRSTYAREIRPSVEFALAKINGVEVNDSTLLKNLDDDLLKRAKQGEKDVLQQLMDKNRDALQVSGPNATLPSIPGLNPGGGSINDMLQGQIKDASGRLLGSDSTKVPPPAPLPKP
ncbi:MAG: tetratricopeptide repeat protein [Ignavibacteria bacterium]|jgi:tetratricopeptide (TPR) repeat protein